MTAAEPAPLEPHEVDALTILALANTWLPLDTWTATFRQADLPDPREWFEEHLQRWVELGLVSVEGKSGVTRLRSQTRGKKKRKKTKGEDRAARVFHPGVAIRLIELAEETGRLPRLYTIFHELDERRYLWSDPSRQAQLDATELRIMLARGESSRMDDLFRDALQREYRGWEPRERWMLNAVGPTPQAAWFETLGEWAKVYVHSSLEEALVDLRVLSPVTISHAEARHPELHDQIAIYRALHGEESSGVSPEVHTLVASFFAGDFPGARATGDRLIAALPRRKYRQLKELPGLVHTLALLFCSYDDGQAWVAFEKTVADAPKAKVGSPAAYAALGMFVRSVRAGTPPSRPDVWRVVGTSQHDPVDDWMGAIVLALVSRWLDLDEEELERPAADFWAYLLTLNEYLPPQPDAPLAVLATQLDAIRLGSKPPPEGSWLGAYRPQEPWKLMVAGLESLAAAQEQGKKKRTRSKFEPHVLWEVALRTGDQAELVPRLIESARSKRGKVISLQKLLDGKVDAASARDREILSYVDTIPMGPVRKSHVLGTRALQGLLGHRHVCLDDGTAVRVVEGTPAVAIEKARGRLRLSVHPASLLIHESAAVLQGTELTYFARTAEIASVAGVLGAEAHDLPLEAEQALTAAVARLGVPVRAEGDVALAGEEVPPQSEPVVVLQPAGAGLLARFRVAPLGLEGPLLEPGAGAPSISALVGERSLRTQRSASAEMHGVNALIAACPSIGRLESGPSGGGPSASGPLEVSAPEEVDSLELLYDLDRAGARLAWPDGGAMRAPSARALQDLRIEASSGIDWLDLDVTLKVDDETALAFRELLARRRGGRFVELDDGTFLALEDELLSRIDALSGLGRTSKKGIQASPVTLPLLEELSEGTTSVFDGASQARLEELAAASRSKPRVPRGFGAELRPYQLEGFRWMSRLATAELGAVLADDMGLGKTVQTLALLQARKKKGPALVVAPTSVASNWVAEAEKFTPKLRVRALREASDRAALIESLRAGDVLIVSYGLLASESTRLHEVAFDTVVFDEAHYLKNERTARARAARGLQARFRLSLTGTPVENHLGELWSLFEATIPGLLGPRKQFMSHFAEAIEAGSSLRLAQLRARLRPFLLRRTKGEVLGELPEKTEITRRVEPSEKQLAFYETARADALARAELEDAQLQILADIMRLRQIAVDPRLLDSKAPAGEKIDALVTQLVELASEGHRAIVFTQFLGAMALVRAELDRVGLSCLELDGATPAKERKRRIDAFQGGEGDVFLMSLKAGGVGVNLTAADYVFHLDPWWNPAVEDQATARSHRMGQESPVTVYRLVTEGTIEEKILELHEQKRSLADDLLANLDKSKKLDLAALRALLG